MVKQARELFTGRREEKRDQVARIAPLAIEWDPYLMPACQGTHLCYTRVLHAVKRITASVDVLLYSRAMRLITR